MVGGYGEGRTGMYGPATRRQGGHEPEAKPPAGANLRSGQEGSDGKRLPVRRATGRVGGGLAERE